jgi:hypothetical protein
MKAPAAVANRAGVQMPAVQAEARAARVPTRPVQAGAKAVPGRVMERRADRAVRRVVVQVVHRAEALRSRRPDCHHRRAANPRPAFRAQARVRRAPADKPAGVRRGVVRQAMLRRPRFRPVRAPHPKAKAFLLVPAVEHPVLASAAADSRADQPVLLAAHPDRRAGQHRARAEGHPAALRLRMVAEYRWAEQPAQPVVLGRKTARCRPRGAEPLAAGRPGALARRAAEARPVEANPVMGKPAARQVLAERAAMPAPQRVETAVRLPAAVGAAR